MAASRHEYVERVVPFATSDGRAGNVINVRGPIAPPRPPVPLVHGAGVRANIFRAPTDTTIVDLLIERGHDVWLENWRASIDFEPVEWTLDQAAVYDHPAAVRTVCRETGAARINAVIHCQESTSFMMSAVAGLVPEVQTIVANAVSLHPVVPRFSKLKLRFALPALGTMTPFLNPHWGDDAPTLLAKAMVASVRTLHRECDNSVCRMVSFIYGSGFPALWRHDNLDSGTHDWIRQEFGAVPLSFFRQMARVRTRRPPRVRRRASRAAARLRIEAAADRRTICVLRRRTESLLPGRESAADVRALRPTAAGLSRTARDADVQPSRRVHREERITRDSRSLPLSSSGPCDPDDDTMTLLPARPRDQTGRAALVDGISRRWGVMREN